MRFPEDRERVASTFDAAADRYQWARPDYPLMLYECLLDVTQLRAPSRRANLADFDVEVVEDRFEDWVPPLQPFDMVFAATAWHGVRWWRARRSVARLETGGTTYGRALGSHQGRDAIGYEMNAASTV